MKRIFFVEDDPGLMKGLVFALEKQGYEVICARTLHEAERCWENGTFDLVILDVSLPDGTGFALCEEIRAQSKVPIIFLTAADEETDIIMGLDMGGDDYITKPFKLAVFLSRVNALLRRSTTYSETTQLLQSGGIAVDLLRPYAGADPFATVGPRGTLYRQQYTDGLHPSFAHEDRGRRERATPYPDGAWHGLQMGES